VVFASDICAEQAQWIQGLFCLVNGDIAPDADTVGKYVGVNASYDKIVSARNTNLAEAKGCEVSALRGVWAKGTISKGVKVLCELRPYAEIMEMSFAELSEWVEQLAAEGSLAAKYSELFPTVKVEKEASAVLAQMIATAIAYAAKHELDFDATLAAVRGA